ncbi:MAG: hypothetical protein ACM31D_09215 [Bacteroidota bacterium]
MPLPRQSPVLATVVGLLLVILGVLVGINLPVSEMNERMARNDAAIKTMAEQRQKGIEAWRNSPQPASPPPSLFQNAR